MKPLKLKGFINNTNKDIGAVVFAFSFYILGVKIAESILNGFVIDDPKIASDAVLVIFGLGVIMSVGGGALYLGVLKPYFQKIDDKYEYGKNPLYVIVLIVLILGMFFGWGIDLIKLWNKHMQ